VLVMAVALFIAFATSTARAGGVVGDGTPGSCTETAFTNALSGGGTVTFNCGGPHTLLLLSVKNITQDTVIDGGGLITLTGGLATRLLQVDAAASLALSNITLDSAFSNNGSGGAIWSAGVLTLTHVTIQNSKTSLCGGAMLVAGNTSIVDSTFTANAVSLGGGAICVRSQPGTQVSVTGSMFMNNQAVDTTTGYGGAIYVEYGNARVRDSAFLFNSAHLGGAVYASYSNALITLEGSATDTPFASALQLNGNSASEDGGAIYNRSGIVDISNAVLTVNRTPTQTLLAGFGGAIYSGGVLTLTQSIVARNEGRFGGGVFVGNSSSARAWIDHTMFLRNVSGNRGGGLYTNDATTLITISNSAFYANTAQGGGGGLARFNAALSVFDSSFTQNTAAAGGGLFLGAGPSPSSGPYVRMQSVTVSSNTAIVTGQGGGIFNYGTVELYSMTIVTNTNGVFSALGGNTRFRNSVLQNPGYLNCDGDGSAHISDDSHNFSTDNSCPLPISQTGLGLDPRLAPLTADTPGSLFLYHMPLADSPLIDAGYACPPRDQRGANRAGPCDIGAVEYAGFAWRSLVPIVVRQ